MTNIPQELQSKISSLSYSAIDDWREFERGANSIAVQLAKAVEALRIIDEKCNREDGTAWGIAIGALEEYKTWLKGE